MNIKIMSTLCVLLGCGLAMTIISCNGDGVADTPSQPTHGVKTPHLQADGCNSTLAVDRCAVGRASTVYDDLTGVLSVTGAVDAESGVKSTIADGYNWYQQIKTSIPQNVGDQISFVAYDGIARQSRLDVTRDPAEIASPIALEPTFDAGDGIFNIEVYDDGVLVGRQGGLAGGSAAKAKYSDFILAFVSFHLIDYYKVAEQYDKRTHINESAIETGACAWVIGSSASDAVEFTLPNGSVVQGDEIRLIEEVAGDGRYPYHAVSRVDVLSNMGTFDILSEHASN